MNPLQPLAKWWRARDRKRRRDDRYAPQVEHLELRCLPATTITAAFGAGAGGGPQVTVLFDDGTRTSFFAFNPAFTGGVSVTTGQVNGSGIPDVIVGAGRGGGPEVKVFDGAQLVAGNVVATADFLAFPSTFTNGVTVATGHINEPAHADVVVAAGPGGGTRVKVFNGADLVQNQAVPTADFAAFDPAFQGRLVLATGPVNGTGRDDLVVAAGPGGGPNVRVFDGAHLHQGQAVATANFFAFAPAFTGGVTLAIGRVNGTQNADVVTGAGPGGGPEVRVFDGAHLQQGQAVASADFFAYDPGFTGGVSVAVGNINGTGFRDVVTGAGPGGGPDVRVFDGAQLARNQVLITAQFMAFDPSFTGGVQVAVAPLDGTGRDAVIAFAGPGGGPQVVIVNSTNTPGRVFVPVPLLSFFAFSPFFLGGFGYGGFFGYGNYFGYGRFLGGGFGTGASFSGLPTSGFTAGSPSGFGTGGFTGPFTSGGFGSFPGGGFGSFSGGGFSGGSFGGFSGGFGGFSGGGFSGGGFGGGSFQRAAGGRLAVGSQAQGGGVYLAPGQLSLASLLGNAETAGGGSAGSHAPPGTLGTSPTARALQLASQEALSWWDAAGITAAQDQQLRAVHFQITNLGGDALGRTTGDDIQLSTTAAGYGWFIDTPSTLRFGAATANGLAAGPNSPAAGHIDLATVVAHEMGHVLGLKDNATSGDLMALFLPAGTRREPTASDLT